MLARKYEEFYTAEDYQKWKGDWELIYGSIYPIISYSILTHQIINGKILKQLSKKLDNCSSCQPSFSIDWEIYNDTVVRPDTIVICYEPDEKLTKKPEIIFEIASPSTIKRDETVKFDIYQNEGVKYYIIVYPKKQIAKVYKLQNGRYVKENDFSNENYNFEMGECNIDFNFSKIWRFAL